MKDGPSRPGGIGRLAVRKRVLTVGQLLDCQRLRETLRHLHGLDYTLGQVIFERVYAANPRTRPTLSRPDGVAEILGGDPGEETGFWKFTKAGHDAFLERVRKDDLVGAVRQRECKDLQSDLAWLGILRRLGEIYVDKGYVDRELAAEYLTPIPDVGDLPSLAFARIAVHNGLVGEHDAAYVLELADAIEEDLGLRLPTGQVFYEQGLLRRREVEEILATQVRVGRLPVGAARLRSLKLSEDEEDLLIERLLERSRLGPADIDEGTVQAARLAEYGLDLNFLEILWVQDRLDEEDVADALAAQREVLDWYDPEPPTIVVSIAPSVDWLAGRGPGDLTEEDFLFGQFAVVAAALDRDELGRAVSIHRRCRKELDLPYSLGQVLFDLYRHHPVRYRRLRRAQRDLSEVLGRPYDVPFFHLSPVELQIAESRIAEAAGENDLEDEIEAAIRSSRILSESGLDKHAIEVLHDRSPVVRELIRDLVREGKDRDRRMKGGWRARRPSGEAKGWSLLERAFSANLSTPGWGRGHLGNLAVEKGLIEPSQLVEALCVQLRVRQMGVVKPFGEVLVELGLVTADQLAILLRLQEERVAVIREEAEVPGEGLGGIDDILLDRIRATGVLDRERIDEVLRACARLRGLGLKASLEEVLVRRGDLDEDIVRGLLVQAERDERTRRLREAAESLRRQPIRQITSAFDIHKAYRGAILDAVDEKRRRLLEERLPGAYRLNRVLRAETIKGLSIRDPVVLATLFAGAAVVIAIVSVTLALREPPRREPFVLRSPHDRRRSGPVRDDSAFARSMRARGMVQVGERWMTVDEARRFREEEERRKAMAPPTIEERRAAFSQRMAEGGYVEIAGGWLKPDAYERLVDAGQRPGQVRSRGRWRPIRTGLGGDRSPTDLDEQALTDLELTLLGESERTRIGLRFLSRLPAGAAIGLRLIGVEDRVLHTAILRPGRSGRIEIEADPVERSLTGGAYQVDLDYRPGEQSADVRREAPRAAACSGLYVLGDPAETAALESEERARYAASLELLARCLDRIAGPTGERRPVWARERLSTIRAEREALVARAGSRFGPLFAGARDRLIGTCRLLVEILVAIAGGAEPGPDRLARAGEVLGEARRLLEDRF